MARTQTQRSLKSKTEDRRKYIKNHEIRGGILMKHKILAIAMAAAMVLAMVTPVLANPPYPEGETVNSVQPGDVVMPLAARSSGSFGKTIDQPNIKDYLRIRERQRLLKAGQTAEANALAQTGTDRVLVILVEFAGQDEFVWQAPTGPYSETIGLTGSVWDPLGIADTAEDTGVVGDCTNIAYKVADEEGLTITDTWGTTFTFTYEGPLHNMMARPISTTDRSGDSIWTDDFDPQWFDDFMFGNGVEISYTMQSDEGVYESFIGQSVADYFSDLSSGTYTITGDVIGWLGVDHSTWYYDTDSCPGARSGDAARGMHGTTRDLVRDALDAVNAISNTIAGFDWANYDLDDDGIIDRLWIVHAGYGEEDATSLLNADPVTGTNRTDPYPAAFYGESAVWSHSSQVTPAYPVSDDVAAGAYIVMPENGGIGVFAHEYGHNLGAWDLYAYGNGYTSAGFWALQADDWTGYPIGFEPPAPDPMHLDMWGWLDPLVVTDTTQTYEAYIGQASYFDTNTAPEDAYRGVKIELPDGELELPVPVWGGDYYWWGGKQDEANAMMTTADPIDLSAATAATLTFDLVYDIEDEWDFLWVQVSEDGVTWPYSYTLTNANTQCEHDAGWIGGEYDFPEDLCGAGIGGFYGYNANWPDPEEQVFDLSDFVGDEIYLRLWFMTDWATTYTGAFVDNMVVESEDGVAFEDNAESGDAKWDYVAPWMRTDGMMTYDHYYYLQWRNVGENGGYDSALGEERWRFGPANTGLLVWYNNTYYTDNEIWNYLRDMPSWGPKGNTLVIDAHPEPYRDPDLVALGYNNEGGNLTSRGQMRDAPFTLQDTVSFTHTDPYRSGAAEHFYQGRPAMSTFNDALGYYPGSEYVNRGPAYPPTSANWVTKQWDASAVVPAKAFYPLNAPGYTANEPFRFYCTPYLSGPNAGYLGCYWYGSTTGLGYDGGYGNPGDVTGQYGWVVELIDEGADGTWGEVMIYNQRVTFTPSYAPAAITGIDQGDPYTITYQTVIENKGGQVADTVCLTYTLDSALTGEMTVVKDGTVVLPGTLELPAFCATTMWPGDVVTVTVEATGAAAPGTVDTLVAWSDGLASFGPFSQPTTIEVNRYIFLPLVMRNF
jgi:immune inhibitor A